MSIIVPPYRLFDCIQCQKELGEIPNALNAKRNKKWEAFSTKEIALYSLEIAAGLLSCVDIKFVEGNEEETTKIAIISSSCPEWMIIDMAVQQTGAILVPLYPTTNPLEIVHILNEAEVKAIFVGSEELYKTIEALKPQLPSLQYIYIISPHPTLPNLQILKQQSNAQLIEEVKKITKRISPHHVVTMIYTSGTTGLPKGVVLTHQNIISSIFLCKDFVPMKTQLGIRTLSFLPLNHIFEKTISYVYLFSGFQIYYAESLDTIAHNLQEVKPHYFTTVPRLLEKIYEKIIAKGNALTGIKRKLFFWSLSLANQFDYIEKKKCNYQLQLWIARKLVFSKWQAALGGEIKAIIVGGAAAPEKILHIFGGAGIRIIEGYGPTENSPVITANRLLPKQNMIGSVGLPLAGIEVKLADDGEICVKGSTVMKGYYKKPELTKACIIDGWYHTDDLGQWIEKNENKFLKIIGRKKELFKTSGGKFVAPVAIENKFKLNMYVNQIMIVGENRKFVIALIVPNFINLIEWLKKNNISFNDSTEDLKKIIQLPIVLSLFDNIIKSVNTNLNHVEQIKKFTLLLNEWTIEKNEITPKLSMKRKIIENNYKTNIEALYE